MEEGALLSELAPPVQVVVSAPLGVPLVADAGKAGEAVTGRHGVDPVTANCKLAVSVLVELADSGHFVFLVFCFSETVRTFCSSHTSDLSVAAAVWVVVVIGGVLMQI